jgi:hypothetical protein
LWRSEQVSTSTSRPAGSWKSDDHVPQPTSTIIEEMVAAARGIAAVTVGDRRAPSYFDFSLRGLAGSFIAFLVATAFGAYLPTFIGRADTGLPTSRLILMAGMLFAAQLGFSALALRQIKRLDGLLPYLVADNWAAFYVTALSSILMLVGLPSTIAIGIVDILVLVIEINIARVIVMLGPWQIAMLLIAQLVGVCVGLLVIALVVPLPAAAVALGP